MKHWFLKHRTVLVAMLVTLLFVAGNSLLLMRQSYFALALPLAGLIILCFVLRFEEMLLAIALLTPFAVNIALVPQMELSIPVEPLMILFAAIFLFRVLASHSYDTRILRHPVGISILLSLVWMLFTAFTSEMVWVSVKYWLSRLWFVIPFFFAATQIFRNPRRIRQFFTCYTIGLCCVIAIATAKTIGNFSDLQTLHRVMKPFYNDHTAYGCAIALFVPAALYFILSKKDNLLSRIFYIGAFVLLIVGLCFSYCRAAWISVIAVLCVYIVIRMGMKIKWMVICFAMGVGLFFSYQSEVIYKMGKNHQDSSYDLSGQIKSISNISTDASNLERLNRWASAIRMWQERPIVGTGPGTYQFLYASYQRSYQLSVISTNAGDLGNAHSEYIGPLTEQGVPGVLLVCCVFMATFATGVKVYRNAKDRNLANLALALTLSLLTYYIHGVFNNFLDTDKLSVPFWGFTAAIVALDLYTEKRDCTKSDSDAPSRLNSRYPKSPKS